MIAIITTLHKKEDAISIGKGLLQKRLIACYNLWPIESAYWWKGEILDEAETVMLLKTTKENYEKVSGYIKEKSGYEVPDIFCLNPAQINPLFNKWISEEAGGA